MTPKQHHDPHTGKFSNEELLIELAGKPVAKIIPYQATRKPRHLGGLHGKIKISKDFDEWPQGIAKSLGIE